MSKTRFFTPIENIEPDALEQISDTASMPFVEGVAVMPDVHLGKGSTVGTVVATRGAIMPACVGVDIGCGMIAVRTSLTPEQVRPHLREIREGIERRIPLGIGPYGQNNRILPSAAVRIAQLEAHAQTTWTDISHMNARSKDWRNALGSLGGGNHFIEVCIGHNIEEGFTSPHWDEVGEVWIILHSGSRGVGNKTGTHWTNVAQEQAKRYMYDEYLPNPDLAYLVEHSEEFWQYMKELIWCQEFALLNREEMMDRVLTELSYTVLGAEVEMKPISCSEGCQTVEVTKVTTAGIEVERINCHHNFVQRENWGGKNLWITRKGAIASRVGMKALIPGSMGAQSYIVEGLGCEGAYGSAPHGAGRKMSRTQARKQFDLASLTAQMEDLGIEARVRKEILDESPGAYKAINQVLQESALLVRSTHVLRQMISVKGD